MESINEQPDLGLRTTDFFDDSTDDDVSTKGNDSLDDPEKLGAPKSPSTYLGGQSAGECVTHCKDDAPAPVSHSKSSPPVTQGADVLLWLTMTPDLKHNTRLQPPERPPRPEILVSDVNVVEFSEEVPIVAQARPLSIHRPSSGHIVNNILKAATTTEEPAGASSSAAVEAAKDELIMNAHTQTLQALLRDESALQQGANRISWVAGAESTNTHPAALAKKRVSLAPLPIDIPHGSLPDDLVRTPYPLHFRKIHKKPGPIDMSAKFECESILPLIIRRCGNHSHRPQRITHITLPAAELVDIVQASPGTKDKHFESLEWDDSRLFRELNAGYRELAGPYRHFSARSLQSIQLSHSSRSDERTGNNGNLSLQDSASCCHSVPHSLRYLESGGLTNSFSEQELIKGFRNPALGRSRYAWVHWAKRTASYPSYLCSPAPDPPAGSSGARLNGFREKEEGGGENGCRRNGMSGDYSVSLEFVEGWSWRRIVLAIVAVKTMAFAAALCWIFLGNGLQPYEAGYRTAGQRVMGGASLGVFTLLTGWTGLVGWIALSALIQ